MTTARRAATVWAASVFLVVPATVGGVACGRRGQESGDVDGRGLEAVRKWARFTVPRHPVVPADHADRGPVGPEPIPSNACWWTWEMKYRGLVAHVDDSPDHDVDRLKVFIRYQGSDAATLRLGDELVRRLGGRILRPGDRSIQGYDYYVKSLDSSRQHLLLNEVKLRLLEVAPAPTRDAGVVAVKANRETVMRELARIKRAQRDKEASIAQLESGHCVAAYFEIAIPGLDRPRCERIAAEVRKDRRFKYVICDAPTVWMVTQ